MATATNTLFNDMLKKYMPYELLFEETMKRDYFLSSVEKDQSWTGGEMQIPFMGGAASSYAFGQLTDITDITEDRPILGKVSDYKEIWGSMVFNDQDLHRHGDMKTSFLKILPSRLEDFIVRMKEAVSVNLLNGSHLLTLDVASGDTNLGAGIVVVDRPARVSIGQFLELGTVGTLTASGYVSAVNIELKTITVVDNKALAPGVPVGFGGLLAGDKAFIRGGTTANQAFTSLKEQLLPASAGGSANLFGISKLAYPHLQCPAFDGNTITGANILDKIFGFYNETRTLGKGMPTDCVMSFKHLGSAMAALEVAREYTITDTKVNKFGWTEINIVGVKGQLKLVGVQEMDDSEIYFLDWAGIKLHSNGFFERRESPDGNAFYEVRSTSGYQYVVDTRFFGELVVTKPSHCGAIYNIAYV